MTKQQYDFIEACKQAHNPELAKKSGMLIQIWQDGEITSQKCGELLHQRTLHCLIPRINDLSKHVPKESMPEQMYNNGTAFIESFDKAEELRKILTD